MRKIFLAFTCILVMACQGVRIASTPVQTDPQEIQPPTAVAISTQEDQSPTLPAVQAAEATVVATPTPIAVVPIPVRQVQIEGVPYQAYQLPGDPFRFVCQEPCPLDEQYIYAEYAGFRAAHAKLIQLTGVDTLAELQPVDMHLVLEDSVCGDAPYGHAYVYSGTHQAFTCTEGPGYYPTIEEKIRMAARTRWAIFSTARVYAHHFLWKDLRKCG